MGHPQHPPKLDELDPADHRQHRFKDVMFRGEVWDLSHLDPFAFRLDPGLGFELDVVVLFGCHCFTHGADNDDRGREGVPVDEWFDDGRERRVLCPERYTLSRNHLRPLVRTLHTRRIIVAHESQGNFVTFEYLAPSGATRIYAVFFEVDSDRNHRKRVLLRVQSAYEIEQLSNRQRAAKPVGFEVLVRKAYLGEMVRP